ncbi:MAG: hypothetical protein AAF196_17365, partial [Planctomycetota bacterium]
IRVDLRPPASRRSQPLLWRACGLDQGRRRIVDATAGLGRDTALLLQGPIGSVDAKGQIRWIPGGRPGLGPDEPIPERRLERGKAVEEFRAWGSPDLDSESERGLGLVSV